MNIAANNYLDLYSIVAYEVIGSPALFVALGLILIAFFSAKCAIPFQVGFLLMFLFTAIVAAITGFYSAWVLVVFVIGLLFYWVLSRILRRG